MAFPAAAEEIALHERVLAGDPVAPVDFFQGLMEPLAHALMGDLPCTEDEAYDSGVDAILAYLEEPGRYDRNRGPSVPISWMFFETCRAPDEAAAWIDLAARDRDKEKALPASSFFHLDTFLDSPLEVHGCSLTAG